MDNMPILGRYGLNARCSLMGRAGKGRFQTAEHDAQSIRYCNQDVLDSP